MHFLTQADYIYLERLGIRTVCDFRSTDERRGAPALWPAGRSPRILADDYRLDTADMGVMPGPATTAEKARASMAAMYPSILTKFNSQYRRMFVELLAGHAPLAFNCTAGKDRTGIAAAFLLTALGVPRRTVIEDYLLTNRYLDPTKVSGGDGEATRQWRSLPSAVREATIRADPTYIGAAFQVLDTHQGGAVGYLQDELGLNRDALIKLRSMYTMR